MADERAGVAAIGHTADDQAETALLALLRGGGLDALSGMRPVRGPFVRPLLTVRRDEAARFCTAIGLRPRRDPMNEDPERLRVAVRGTLPALARAVGRGVVEPMARTADLLARDAEFLDDLARAAARGVVGRDERGPRIDADGLAALPPPIATRVIRTELRAAGLVARSDHIEAVTGLASGRGGREVRLPGRLRAVREGRYVRLLRPSPGPLLME
jgi:tRNA(Ile)-lysidine synthase